MFCIILVAGAIHAETVDDREGAVRDDKRKMESAAIWIYKDIKNGFAEAQRTGKSLLVVLRCVPCLSCANASI